MSVLAMILLCIAGLMGALIGLVVLGGIAALAFNAFMLGFEFTCLVVRDMAGLNKTP